MRWLMAVALVGISTVVQAKDITLSFNDEEQKAMLQILDIATKAAGLQQAQTTLYFWKKFEDATKPAVSPPTAEPQK